MKKRLGTSSSLMIGQSIGTHIPYWGVRTADGSEARSPRLIWNLASGLYAFGIEYPRAAHSIHSRVCGMGNTDQSSIIITFALAMSFAPSILNTHCVLMTVIFLSIYKRDESSGMRAELNWTCDLHSKWCMQSILWFIKLRGSQR